MGSEFGQRGRREFRPQNEKKKETLSLEGERRSGDAISGGVS